jgi:hypothetical protein
LEVLSLEICKPLRACLGEICNQVLNTLASTDITSIIGDMPYHGRSDVIEKLLGFSKVSADLLTELTDTLNIDQAVFAGLSLRSFLV